MVYSHLHICAVSDQLFPRPHQDHSVPTDGSSDIHRWEAGIPHLPHEPHWAIRLHKGRVASALLHICCIQTGIESYIKILESFIEKITWTHRLCKNNLPWDWYFHISSSNGRVLHFEVLRFIIFQIIGKIYHHSERYWWNIDHFNAISTTNSRISTI